MSIGLSVQALEARTTQSRSVGPRRHSNDLLNDRIILSGPPLLVRCENCEYMHGSCYRKEVL